MDFGWNSFLITYNSNYNTIARLQRDYEWRAYLASYNNHFPIRLTGELGLNYDNLFKYVSLAMETSKYILDFNGNKFSQQGMHVEKISQTSSC
ncbi:hypothetical protein [Parafilimonas sp.]|uniref:hypothetical protein n=1 Tax=Parafilimonas sp. TaxID=1969739 RepID=UPI003F7D83FD